MSLSLKRCPSCPSWLRDVRLYDCVIRAVTVTLGRDLEQRREGKGLRERAIVIDVDKSDRVLWL